MKDTVVLKISSRDSLVLTNVSWEVKNILIASAKTRNELLTIVGV